MLGSSGTFYFEKFSLISKHIAGKKESRRQSCKRYLCFATVIVQGVRVKVSLYLIVETKRARRKILKLNLSVID